MTMRSWKVNLFFMAVLIVLRFFIIISFRFTGAGNEIVVNSAAYSGLGTLLWVLQMAIDDSVNIFNPVVYTAHVPATICLAGEKLPVMI